MKHEHEHEHEHKHDHCSCGCDHDHSRHPEHDHDILSGGCSCGCGHDHDHGEAGRKDIVFLIIGAVLFVSALLMEYRFTAVPEVIVATVCVVAYLILGKQVLLASARNILKGKVFDENFLMSIATLAAFGIGDYPEAVGVMLFYNVGELFEHISVDRSRKKISEAVDMRPETVNVQDADGNIRVVAAADVAVGTTIRINPGERIPLDGVVLTGEGIIDTSPITGEPVPVRAGRDEALLSGCINTRGSFTMRVTAPLEESMVSRILKSVETASESKPEIERFITRFAQIYTPIVVILALAVALVPPLAFGGEWKYWIVTAITFLVISCPCAMVISVPLAYFLGIGAASGRGILIKGGQTLEALRKIKAVALDKTGTITKGTVDDAGLLDTQNPDKKVSFEEAFASKTVTGDELKDDAASGIARIIRLGLIPVLLTGDRKDRAEEIASQAGIDVKNVRAQLLPDEKFTVMQELRDEYGPVMFVGDGINDAPVLAGADVGAAMGSGADAAIESADMVFMNSNVEAIPQALEIAGRTGKIARQNIVLALAIKLIVLIMGFTGFANIWMAVFADTGAAMLCILNSLRLIAGKPE